MRLSGSDGLFGLRRRRAWSFSGAASHDCAAYVGPEYDFLPAAAGVYLSKLPAATSSRATPLARS